VLVLLGALLALEVLIPACGTAEGRPSEPVAASQAKLSDIKSATLALRLTGAAGAAAKPEGAVGFELAGPFSPPTSDGGLPVARLEATRVAGSRRTVSTFLSDGTRAVVQTGGKTVPLTPEQLAPLRGTKKGGADLGGLHLDSWFWSRTTTQAGDATKVTGMLDAPKAINDVFALAGAFGAGTGQHRLEGDDAERVRALVRSSEVELVTGSSDNVLRSLRFDVAFGTADAGEVAKLVPELSGASLHFELRLSDVGKPVRVEVPGA
jgi:hypothetical protein